MNMMPPPLKETRPAAEVVEAFLSLRHASAEEVIQSRAATRAVVQARHELMWFLRDLTHLSLAEIGQVVGGRDAKTVRHGIDQISDRIASDEGYRREMLFARAVILRGAEQVMTPDLCLTAVRAVLADAGLSDADARQAALQLMGPRHG
ncbi:MAG: hypothetical protein KF887_06980 [Paracoccaceae bacterium]|nr:MAG: hypothetical protein KF887_06980 [Paracoccaceae bacterium]